MHPARVQDAYLARFKLTGKSIFFYFTNFYFMRKQLTETSVCTRFGRLFAASCMLAGVAMTASAAAPTIEGYNFKEGAYLFPSLCDTLKVKYSEPVEKSYWEVYQNGTKVLEGTDDGMSMGQPYSTFKIQTALSDALLDGTLKTGNVDFKIAKVEYDGDQTAENVGSVTWDLTDAYFCNMMYPTPNPDKRAELKIGTTVCYYGLKSLGSNAQLKSVTAQFVQDGKVVHVMEVAGTQNKSTLKWQANVAVKFTQEILDELYMLTPGAVDIYFVQENYISAIDGEEKSIRIEPALPCKTQEGLAAAYYAYAGEGGKIVAESLVEYEDEILSYYPADGEEGTITYTANQPLADGIKAVLSYGTGDYPMETPVPVVMSTDKKSFTIDLRGMVNSASKLSGGATFKDDDGNVIAPPSTVSVSVTNLMLANGVSVVTEYRPPNGGNPVTLSNRLWRTYNFKDLSFADPKITNVVFYDKDGDGTYTENIKENSNMVEIQFTGSDVIETADVEFAAGEVLASVAAADITRDTDVWTMALPESIAAEGSAELVVSLTGLSFNKVDGQEHTVAPFDFANKAPETPVVQTVKELYDTKDGAAVILQTEGVMVTLSSADQGLMTAEDKTGAFQIATDDYSAPFAQGDMVSGRLEGYYAGAGLFVIDLAASEYTVSPVDVTIGRDITNVNDVFDNDNLYRLLTFTASADMPIYYDEDYGTIMIGEDGFYAVDAMGVVPADYEYPENIASVTGVLFELTGVRALLIRSTEDIQEGVALPEFATLAELVSQEPGTMVSVNLTDAKVTHDIMGMAFLQDDTAAIMVVEGFDSTRGTLINGKLTGMYYGSNTLLVDPAASDFTESDVDVTKGEVIDFADLADPKNMFRLVTFYDDELTPIEMTEAGPVVAGSLVAADMFEVFDMDYEYPSKVKSLTGILYPMNAGMMDDFEDDFGGAGMMYVLVPRDSDDWEADDSTGVASIFVDGKFAGDVYDLNGLKVRSEGESLNGLADGVYVINGKKLFIRR